MRKAQATLEFTLIFVIIIALLASLFVMWQWSMGNMVTRQKLYSSQRTQAGSTDTPGEPLAQEKVKALTDEDMVYPEN